MEPMGGGDPGVDCCDVDEDCLSFSRGAAAYECACEHDGPGKGTCVYDCPTFEPEVGESCSIISPTCVYGEACEQTYACENEMFVDTCAKD